MKKFFILILTIILISTTLTFTSSASSKYTDIMGTPLKNPAYTMDVQTAEYYNPGEIIIVTITLNNITSPDGLKMICFKLYYDYTKVQPIVLNNGENDEMQSFLVKSPNSKMWEGYNHLQEADSRYAIGFVSINDSSIAKEDGSIIIAIPFYVKDTAKGDIVFQVPHAETLCSDANCINCYGNGGIAKANNTAIDLLDSASDSGLGINEEKGFLEGVAGGITAAGLTSQFQDDVVIYNNKGEVADNEEVIGTGFVINNGWKEITAIVLGDGNGDGQANSKDYLLAKRVFFGTYTLEGAELAALCIGGGSIPSASDYLKIKRHFLGTYDLYA